MSITDQDYRRARHIVDPAAELLDTALRHRTRGPAGLHPRILLTGMALAINHYADAHISTIHKTLTEDLTREAMWDLGVLRATGSGCVHTLTLHELYQLSKKVTRKLDHTRDRCPGMPREERLRRRANLDRIADALLDPTLTPRPRDAQTYALDATGIWAFEKSPTPIDSESAPADNCDDDEHDDPPARPTARPEPAQPENAPAQAPLAPGRGSKGPSDARVGSKTSKSGRKESFYGYDCHALVRVPDRFRPDPDDADRPIPRSEPPLVVALVVVPASTNVAEPSLAMIRRFTQRTGETIQHLLVDRHYSYKQYDRWLRPLLALGIRQTADLRSDEQGWKQWNHLKVVAGTPHCPCTPDSHQNIPSPGLNGTKEQWDNFHTAIEQRKSYACQIVNRLDADGKIKVRCPAAAGTLGCPRREGTIASALEQGLPIITNPPTGDDDLIPGICKNDTVTLRVRSAAEKIAMKLTQPHYWGTRAWRTAYARRTYIEGWFGTLKGSTATNVHRGIHNFIGLPMSHIVIATAAAITNMRLLRSWHAETGQGDPNHPLLQPDPPRYGHIDLTAQQAALIDAAHLPPISAPTDAKPRQPRKRAA